MAAVQAMNEELPKILPKGKAASDFLLLAFASSLYAWFAYQLVRTAGRIPIFSDAWSLIEIARSIQLGTFPEIQTARQFKLIDHVFSNTAFPPLTPLLLALHGSQGHWAAAIVHQSILMALALPIPIFFALKKRFTPMQAVCIGLMTTVVTLSYTPYRDDVVSIGTMSLSVLLVGSAFAVLVSNRVDTKEAALLGVLMGLNCLNRMDGLPLAAVMLLAIACVSLRAVPALTYLCALLVALSPWIAVSKTHFGVWLISDNQQVSMALSDHVFRVHGVPADNIAALLRAKLQNLSQFLAAFGRSAYQTKSLLILAAATLWCLASALRKRPLQTPKLWIVLVAAASLLGPAATGYIWATRYASPLVVATALVGSAALVLYTRRLEYGGRAVAQLAQLMCLALVGLALSRISLEPLHSILSQKPAGEIQRALRSLQPAESQFSRLENSPRVFFALNRTGPSAAAYAEIFRIGALGSIHAIPQPYDWNELPPDEQRILFGKLRVDLVAGACAVHQSPEFVMSLSGYQGCLYSPAEWWLRR